MTRWTLTPRDIQQDLDLTTQRVDGSGLDPIAWKQGITPQSVLMMVGAEPLPLDTLFRVAIDDDPLDRIVIDGDCRWLDRVGAAADGRRIGINGGRIEIHGDVGDLIGHRMRRGMICIDGNVGQFCGAGMVAGTIMVSGRFDAGTAIGARRGTLLTGERPSLSTSGFTRAVSVDFPLARLFDVNSYSPGVQDLLTRLGSRRCLTRRGDHRGGGQAEVVWPAK